MIIALCWWAKGIKEMKMSTFEKVFDSILQNRKLVKPVKHNLIERVGK